ncbi:MAG: GNAT family N-acetyltransferase [Chloroflexota bacterium]
MKNFSAPVPVIRPALPRDKADVFEFTKFIWDGHDYVGYVFPEWLEDTRGQLFVVEFAGRCIGTGKVTYLAPGQWWLEGFRIDPKFQGLRIGSKLDAACNAWWDEHGDGALRLMTNAKRVQVRHLSELRGFVKMGETLEFGADALAGPVDAFTPLAPDEAGEAVSFCRDIAPGRLINLGWKFVAPNEHSLRAVAQQGLAWRWRGRSGILTAWENDEDDAPNLTVGFEACTDGDRAALLSDFRYLARARGAAVAGWSNVIGPDVPQILNAAGYQRAGDWVAYLYERFHP